MAGARKERQDAIRDLVRHNHIRTQSDLVAQLRDRGFDVTQATISRDIKEPVSYTHLTLPTNSLV